ncbi:MAG TPA: low-specificity L-threonine aldolase [Bacteroidota bacterium]|nr:low-specificity L-threonine aldolase [Bacteroidota bacterium]
MSQALIDLRSDTVTKPTPAMREAMFAAEVGDDVFAEDPTVNRLQEKVAALLGTESALYMPSGCASNQIALKSHTQPGDEIIVETDAHIFNYETAAPAVLSGIQVKTLQGVRGVFTADQLPPAVRPSQYYMPPTRLIALENTHNRAGGTVYPIDEIKKISDYAHANGILMHLDGARLWNASVATGIAPGEYAKHFDSISVCFSKGLGAPVGSALCGKREFLTKARKWRKVFGCGMRQAGILAAAAEYALDNNIARLKEDHDKARYFAEAVNAVPGLCVDLDGVQTNIILVDVSKTGKSPDDVIALLKQRGVLVSGGTYTTIRAVTHLDVSMEQVKTAVDVIKELFV